MLKEPSYLFLHVEHHVEFLSLDFAELGTVEFPVMSCHTILVNGVNEQLE